MQGPRATQDRGLLIEIVVREGRGVRDAYYEDVG